MRSATHTAFAVYVSEPIGFQGASECIGIRAWACSKEHAIALAQPAETIGPNNDALPGTVCEVCGKTL